VLLLSHKMHFCNNRPVTRINMFSFWAAFVIVLEIVSFSMDWPVTGFTPLDVDSSRQSFGRRKGPFMATQLNVTRRRVELSWVARRSVYSDADATQHNSTDLLRADWLYAGSVALPIVGDSWIASVRVSVATQLNSTQLNSTSSCVAINGPLVAISWPKQPSASVYRCMAQSRHPILLVRVKQTWHWHEFSSRIAL